MDRLPTFGPRARHERALAVDRSVRATAQPGMTCVHSPDKPHPDCPRCRNRGNVPEAGPAFNWHPPMSRGQDFRSYDAQKAYPMGPHKPVHGARLPAHRGPRHSGLSRRATAIYRLSK